MMFKQICLIGVAAMALAVGAQARSTAEEDAITRQLNLDQLDKSKSGENTLNAAPDSRNGQGGPEFKGPPGPNEGMTDEPSNGDDSARAPDDKTPPPDEEKAPDPAPSPKPY